MVICQVDCGLGNQMFQYAAASAAARRCGCELRLDANKYARTKVRRYELADFPNITDPEMPAAEIPVIYSGMPHWTLLRRLGKKNPALMRRLLSRFCFPVFENENPEAVFHLDPRKRNYLVGFWQNARYFADCDRKIRRQFEFAPPPPGKNRELLSSLVCDASCVSIHVRRGDYCEDPDIARAMGGICTAEYYRKAIAEVGRRISNPRFIVFSDGMDYARSALGLPENSVFVDWNGERDGRFDMQLMAACSHHIIANSTFSWWGAYLGRNPGKLVCAPARWDNGAAIKILPESWLAIE